MTEADGIRKAVDAIKKVIAEFKQFRKQDMSDIKPGVLRIWAAERCLYDVQQLLAQSEEEAYFERHHARTLRKGIVRRKAVAK